MSDGNVTLPRGNTSCEVLEVALTLNLMSVLGSTCASERLRGLLRKGRSYIRVRDITASTKHKQHWLPPVLGRCLILQQTRANHTNSIDTTVPDVVDRLDTTARKPSCHDLARIHIGICTSTSGFRDPVNCCFHSTRVRRPSTVRTTLSNGKETIASDILQQSRVGPPVGAAGAVTPDEYREFLGPGVLGWIVDCMAAERVVGFVSAGAEWACSASLLLVLLGQVRN
jgi:hypothetical protein